MEKGQFDEMGGKRGEGAEDMGSWENISGMKEGGGGKT